MRPPGMVARGQPAVEGPRSTHRASSCTAKSALHLPVRWFAEVFMPRVLDVVCRIAAGALLLVALGPGTANAQATPPRIEVDLELALAIDISGSIDPDEALLQRQGYVAAFRDPAIKRAILGGYHGRIAVAYFEWSDAWRQQTLIGWTLLD